MCNSFSGLKNGNDKLHLIAILFIAFSLLGCQTPYLIIGQDKIADSPCVTADTGVNVRIRNIGKITFSKVVLKDAKMVVEYSGLKPGQVSCYKNRSTLWSNPSLDILLSKQQGYVKTLMMVAADHVGESQIKHGYVTVAIRITKLHGTLKVKLDIMKEEFTL